MTEPDFQDGADRSPQHLGVDLDRKPSLGSGADLAPLCMLFLGKHELGTNEFWRTVM